MVLTREENALLTETLAGQFLVADRRHLDMNIDPIEQRTRDTRSIALDRDRRAGAFMLHVAEEAAPPSTGVGDRCQRSARGSTTIPIRRASPLNAGVATPAIRAAAATTSANDTRLKRANPPSYSQGPKPGSTPGDRDSSCRTRTGGPTTRAPGPSKRHGHSEK